MTLRSPRIPTIVNASTHRVAACLLAAAGLFSGCADDKPESFIQSAKEYIAKNEMKAAIIQLKTALQKKPDSAQARFLLGQALLESGDPVSAEVELRKAIDLKHPDTEVLPVLARALNLAAAYRKLTSQYATVELAEPAAAADLKTSIAIAYAWQGDKKQLDAALEAALKAVPDYGPARLVQARLKADERDFDGALRLLDQILAKTPDAYEAWQFKADLLLATKTDLAAAREALAKVLSIRKDFVPAHASMVTLLLAQKDMPAAKAQVEALKKIAPNHLQTKYLEGEVAFLSQDYKTARESAQQILKILPDDLKALQLAGAVEFQGGSLVQAEILLSKALQLAPNGAMTRRLLAQTYGRSGDMGRVLETLAPILESPAADAESLGLAAQAYLQTGDVSRAETYFARAAKLNPTDVKIRTAMAITQFSKGNTDQGYSELQQIAASDTSAVADMALISAYFRQGKFDAAVMAIDALEKKQPGKPLAADLRGRVQLARNDFAGARKSFEAALAIDPAYFPSVAKLAGLDLVDKKPDQARQRFDAVLKADPKNVQALMALAELREKSGGSVDEVASLLAGAVRLNPTVVAPRMLTVEHFMKHKNVKAALTAAQEAVAARPDSAELLDALGRVQVSAGETNQAISSFSKLAEMRPKSPQPQLRLADTYIAMKNNDAARQSLKRALAVAPNLIAAQRGLIALELAAGRPAEALAVAKSVQRAPGSEVLGSLLVGDVEASQKHWDSAAAAYRDGLKKTANIELAMKLHAVLSSSARPAEADKFATGWVKEHPLDATFVQYLGDRALSRANYPLAETHYLEVTRMQPANPVAYNNLAWLTNQLRKPGALAYAEKANALRPDQPAFMDTLATILAASDQVSRAIEIEKKAVQLQPQHAPFRLNLARLYMQAGEKSHARAELDELVKLGDKFAGQDEVSKLRREL